MIDLKNTSQIININTLTKNINQKYMSLEKKGAILSPEILADIARKDLKSYPFNGSFTFESLVEAGVQEAAHLLWEAIGGHKTMHGESGVLAMLRNIFPNIPEKTLRDAVYGAMFKNE